MSVGVYIYKPASYCKPDAISIISAEECSNSGLVLKLQIIVVNLNSFFHQMTSEECMYVFVETLETYKQYDFEC